MKKPEPEISEIEQVSVKLINLFNELHKEYMDVTPTFTVTYVSDSGSTILTYPAKSWVSKEKQKSWKKNMNYHLKKLVGAYIFTKDFIVPDKKLDPTQTHKEVHDYFETIRKERNKPSKLKGGATFKSKEAAILKATDLLDERDHWILVAEGGKKGRKSEIVFSLPGKNKKEDYEIIHWLFSDILNSVEKELSRGKSNAKKRTIKKDK